MFEQTEGDEVENIADWKKVAHIRLNTTVERKALPAVLKYPLQELPKIGNFIQIGG